jgi:hypothetical protein
MNFICCFFMLLQKKSTVGKPAVCREMEVKVTAIVGASTSHNPIGLHRLLQE